MEDAKIFQIIANYSDLMQKNRKSIDYLLGMLHSRQQDEDLIRRAGLPNPAPKPAASGSGFRDLSDTLSRYEKMKASEEELTLGMVRRLLQEREKMSRVYICYQILPEPYKTVLTGIYVNGRNATEVGDSLHRSRKSVEDYRKKGAELIRASFASSLTNEELLCS